MRRLSRLSILLLGLSVMPAALSSASARAEQAAPAALEDFCMNSRASLDEMDRGCSAIIALKSSRENHGLKITA